MAKQMKKSGYDDRGQEKGQAFSDYARQHAERWAGERQGLPPEEATAYAEHYVQTYPNGLDEDGHSVDHPMAYRNWKMAQEETAERAKPKAAPVASIPVKRTKTKPAPIPSGRVAWMHGQNPNKMKKTMELNSSEDLAKGIGQRVVEARQKPAYLTAAAHAKSQVAIKHRGNSTAAHREAMDAHRAAESAYPEGDPKRTMHRAWGSYHYQRKSGKVDAPMPTEKSESRIALLTKGIAAAVELRKALNKADEPTPAAAKPHYGLGRGNYPRAQKDNFSGRMHQELTHLLPPEFHATHRMDASWSPDQPQHVNATVRFKHPHAGYAEALGMNSHGGGVNVYEGGYANSALARTGEIMPHAKKAFGRFLASKTMAPHHPAERVKAGLGDSSVKPHPKY